MTITDAERLQAVLMCERNKLHNACDKDCDNCELCYKQGTMFEYFESLQHAVDILTSNLTVKDIVSNCNPNCYIRILDNKSKLMCLMPAKDINNITYLTKQPIRCINSIDSYSITLYIR